MQKRAGENTENKISSHRSRLVMNFDRILEMTGNAHFMFGHSIKIFRLFTIASRCPCPACVCVCVCKMAWQKYFRLKCHNRKSCITRPTGSAGSGHRNTHEMFFTFHFIKIYIFWLFVLSHKNVETPPAPPPPTPPSPLNKTDNFSLKITSNVKYLRGLHNKEKPLETAAIPRWLRVALCWILDTIKKKRRRNGCNVACVSCEHTINQMIIPIDASLNIHLAIDAWISLFFRPEWQTGSSTVWKEIKNDIIFSWNRSMDSFWKMRRFFLSMKCIHCRFSCKSLIFSSERNRWRQKHFEFILINSFDKWKCSYSSFDMLE